MPILGLGFATVTPANGANRRTTTITYPTGPAGTPPAAAPTKATAYTSSSCIH